jgi:hypothetical protein
MITDEDMDPFVHIDIDALTSLPTDKTNYLQRHCLSIFDLTRTGNKNSSHVRLQSIENSNHTRRRTKRKPN